MSTSALHRLWYWCLLQIQNNVNVWSFAPGRATLDGPISWRGSRRIALEETRLPPTTGKSIFATKPVSPRGASFYFFDLEQSPCCLKSFPTITSPWQDTVRDTGLVVANLSWEATVSSGVSPKTDQAPAAWHWPCPSMPSSHSSVGTRCATACYPPNFLQNFLIKNFLRMTHLINYCSISKFLIFLVILIHLCVLRCSCINYSEPLKDNEVSVALCFISRVLQVKTNYIMLEPGFSEESPLS